MILPIFLLLSLLKNLTQGQIFGSYQYTEFYSGDLNVFISIPHDGTLKPTDITDKTNPDPIDYNTRQLGLKLIDELKILFGKTPFAVINNLHRYKMDPNRNEDECCANKYEKAFIAYKDYHNFIAQRFERDFMETGSVTYKQGLLIDLHGQSHPEKWIELGYTLTYSELNLQTLNLTHMRYSSIRQLAALSPLTFEDILRGSSASLGGILQNKYGLKTIPSPRYPGPGNGNYFTGGFITKTYGSEKCKSSRLNAVQIEVPYEMRMDNKLATSAKQLASAIFDYYTLHNLGEQTLNPQTDNLLSIFLCLNRQ